MMSKSIEVCFSPDLFPLFDVKGKIVVVTDILRASSVICTMFDNGVDKVVPVRGVGDARKYKENGFLVVAERNGLKLDFADFGNSPDYFTPDVVEGKTLVYSTTNGTNAISICNSADFVFIGSFLNIDATIEIIKEINKDVLILCAGWKGKFNIEDSVYAGAMVSYLLKDGFETVCDSAISAQDLWGIAKNDLPNYIKKAAQQARLGEMGLAHVIPYCLSFNKTDKVPVLLNGYLKNYRDLYNK